MSYRFDGKVANQAPKISNFVEPRCHCEKCSILLEPPKRVAIKVEDAYFVMRSYINTRYFIYESKSGRSVVYCSRYCRDRHNHRFQK